VLCDIAVGYNFYGTERMYSGIDGREMEVDIFIGVVYYQRLRHMVYDKYQVHYLLKGIALHGNPSQSYGASLAIWDHTVLPATRQVNTSHHNPSQPGRYSIYLPPRDGRLS